MTSPPISTTVVSINGTVLDADALARLRSVVVDDDLLRPDMCAIRFADPERDMATRLHVSFGAAVVVKASRATQDAQAEPLFSGEVVAVESDRGPGGTQVVLVCYDLAHRLTRGTRTTTYVQMSDSDIARKLAGQAGIPIGTVETTSLLYDHVAQINISDWDFLSARAQRIGYEVGCSGGSFSFARAKGSHSAPADDERAGAAMGGDGNRALLVYGETLLAFHPRVSSAGQVGSVQVTGWDPKAKTSVVGDAALGTTVASVDRVPASSMGGQGHGQVLHAVHHQVSSAAEAKAVATALSDRLGSTIAEAEGMAVGDPTLTSGSAIRVAGLGWPADGTYTLTRTRHVFDERGYRTELYSGGRNDRSLLGLASLGASRASGASGGQPVPGVVVGIVTNIADPEKMGRVKVTFPWLPGTYETDWCRMAQLGAGAGRGSTFLPDVADEVLVAFGHGDVQTPYVVGQLHNGKDRPATEYDGGKEVAKRAIVSREKHRLVFEEKDGVTLTTGDDKHFLHLSKAKTVIEISSGGAITIHADQEIAIDGQKISLEALTDLSLKGVNVKIEASAQLDLKAAAGGTLDGGATTTIKGGLVQIN